LYEQILEVKEGCEMAARAARAGGQSTTAGRNKDAARSSSDEQVFQSISFHLGSHACWAVRPNSVDLGYPNREPAPGESESRTLCGWLRIGGEAYLVLTRADKADDAAHPVLDHNEPWEILSEREMQIAMLVTLGKGTKQIAGQLRISEHTVQSYMRRIFFKLHVSTRTAMVAQLLRLRIGLADPGEARSKSDGRH
jgi:DNA-binding CsgD family transcriptional regulator